MDKCRRAHGIRGGFYQATRLQVAVLSVQALKGQQGVNALLARLPNANQDAARVGHGCLAGRLNSCQPQDRILPAIPTSEVTSFRFPQ